MAKTLPELCPLIPERPLPSLRDVCPELSRRSRPSSKRCLQRDPAERYSDVGELMKDLAPFAAPATNARCGPSPPSSLAVVGFAFAAHRLAWIAISVVWCWLPLAAIVVGRMK